MKNNISDGEREYKVNKPWYCFEKSRVLYGFPLHGPRRVPTPFPGPFHHWLMEGWPTQPHRTRADAYCGSGSQSPVLSPIRGGGDIEFLRLNKSVRDMSL